MIPVEGGEVWAADSETGDSTLVLLHPGVGDSRFWDPFLQELTAEHRVIRYDARGYGRSPAAMGKFNLYDDFLAVLGHLGVERAALVGCSQGGATALAAAVLRPELVSALVLLAPGVPGAPDGPEDPRVAQLFADYEDAGGGLDAMVEVIRALWAAGDPTPEVDEQLRSAAKAWLVEDEFEYEQPIPPIFDRLGEITVPCSLLVGDIDRPNLIAANRAAAARIPDCEFVEVPGVDHLPALRVPDLVLGLIRRTLAQAH